jgi:4-carboxymuconolactone decarboxylase
VSRPEPRIAKLAPGSLDADQRRVYDAIAGGRRASGPKLFTLVDDDGALEGPFNGFLLQPRVGGALEALGSAVRFGTSFSDRAREIAILMVAQHWDSGFMRYSHEAVGRHAGLTDAEVTALREGRWDVFEGEERLIARTSLLLATDGDLDDQDYAAVQGPLGDSGLFELVTLVGYYATLALQLRVFRVGVPDD